MNLAIEILDCVSDADLAAAVRKLVRRESTTPAAAMRPTMPPAVDPGALYEEFKLKLAHTSRGEAARELKVSPSTLRTWIKARAIPARARRRVMNWLKSQPQQASGNGVAEPTNTAIDPAAAQPSKPLQIRHVTFPGRQVP
jgi:DNA-binding transcriptional regulator YiaG